MKEWQDIGIVLSARKYGEQKLILEVFTPEHGRHKGLLNQGKSSRSSSVWQTGNLVEVSWRARLEEHLGNYTCEIIKPYCVAVFDNPLLLASISSLCAELSAFLPERDLFPNLFLHTKSLLDNLESPTWLSEYCHWELELLAELGFSLDFTKCALTGETENLAFVSPKTGRAVTAAAAAPWKEKLLPLPSFLATGEETASVDDILSALKLTGYFLSRQTSCGELPAARFRLQEKLSSLF